MRARAHIFTLHPGANKSGTDHLARFGLVPFRHFNVVEITNRILLSPSMPGEGLFMQVVACIAGVYFSIEGVETIQAIERQN